MEILRYSYPIFEHHVIIKMIEKPVRKS